MAVAGRAVDRHPAVHQPLAGRVDIVDAIGEVPEIAPARIGFGGAAVRRRPVVGQLDLGVRAFSGRVHIVGRSEEHTSELQSLMRISYAVFCLKTKKIPPTSNLCCASKTYT